MYADDTYTKDGQTIV